MLYILNYKGTCLGKPMERPEAEARLQQMSRCFNGLQIVPWRAKDHAEAVPDAQKLG